MILTNSHEGQVWLKEYVDDDELDERIEIWCSDDFDSTYVEWNGMMIWSSIHGHANLPNWIMVA